MITEPKQTTTSLSHTFRILQTRTETHNKIKRLFLNHYSIAEAVWHIFVSALHQLNPRIRSCRPTGADRTWHFHCYYRWSILVKLSAAATSYIHKGKALRNWEENCLAFHMGPLAFCSTGVTAVLQVFYKYTCHPNFLHCCYTKK